jgi:hypothetical protein
MVVITMGSDESLVYLSGMMSITRVVTSQYEISKLAKVAFNGLIHRRRRGGLGKCNPLILFWSGQSVGLWFNYFDQGDLVLDKMKDWSPHILREMI